MITSADLKARRAEIDRKEARMPFRAANVRPRQPMTPYTNSRPR